MSAKVTQYIEPPVVYVENSAKIYIIIGVISVLSSMICIFISNSMSTPPVAVPVATESRPQPV